MEKKAAAEKAAKLKEALAKAEEERAAAERAEKAKLEAQKAAEKAQVCVVVPFLLSQWSLVYLPSHTIIFFLFAYNYLAV